MCPASSGQGPHTGSSEDWLCPFASLCHLQHKVRSVTQSTVNICGVELKNIRPQRVEIQGTNLLQVGKPQVHKRGTHDSGEQAALRGPFRTWRGREKRVEEGQRKKKGQRMGRK